MTEIIDQPARSRIVGDLHRSVDTTIRVLQEAENVDGLMRIELSASSEIPLFRQSFFEDPWIEVLGHKQGEVNLARMNSGATVLANHDRFKSIGNTPLAGIGKVESASLVDGRMLATIAISRRDALIDLRNDIADGIVGKVSIGYTIEERVLTKTRSDGVPEYRVTSWTPFEISLVDIPADDTVGIGRSSEDAVKDNYRVIPLSNEKSLPTQKNERKPVSMGVENLTKENETSSASDANSDRAKDIAALGRQHHIEHLAAQAIITGTSLQDFRQIVLGKLVDDGKLRVCESPDIGMSDKDLGEFSFCRAILAAQDPEKARSIAPFELECSQAAQDKRGETRKGREGAITVPSDVLSRINPVLKNQTRDLLVGTPTAGGNLVATDLLSGDFITLLRNAMVLDRLGARVLSGLNGNIAIPSQTGAAQYYWVAENVAPTEGALTFGQVTMAPNTIAAFVDYSRRLLIQSSVDVEMLVRTDLAQQLAQGIQIGCINGAGTDEILGVLNTSGIGSVAGGTNGAAPDWTHIMLLEEALAVANADVGSIAFLTNPKVRKKLSLTPKLANTIADPIWGRRGMESGVGELAGYNAYVTNSVPSNLTKGTSNSVCSAILMGNFADMCIGLWGGLDIMLDPYSMSTTGAKRVVAMQDVDMCVRRVASFAAMKDALTV